MKGKKETKTLEMENTGKREKAKRGCGWRASRREQGRGFSTECTCRLQRIVAVVAAAAAVVVVAGGAVAVPSCLPWASQIRLSCPPWVSASGPESPSSSPPDLAAATPFSSSAALLKLLTL